MKPFQTGLENEYNNMSSSYAYRPFLGIKEWNRIGRVAHLVWYFGKTRTILRKQHMFLYIMHVSSTSTKNMTCLSRTEAKWAKPHVQRNQPCASSDINNICHTVDGRNPGPVEVGSLSHHLRCFVHPRWCRMSSINSRFRLTSSMPCQTFRV